MQCLGTCFFRQRCGGACWGLPLHVAKYGGQQEKKGELSNCFGGWGMCDTPSSKSGRGPSEMIMIKSKPGNRWVERVNSSRLKAQTDAEMEAQ